jgi:hypothetical protein
VEAGYDGWDADRMRIPVAPFSVGLCVAILVPAASLSACGAEPPSIDPTGVDELTIPTPTPDPDDFVDEITNPYLPLSPGSKWTYSATSEERSETITVTVLDETRRIQGVDATVVHDVVTDEDGGVLEDTYDWFAQDQDGNVWYLGEDTTEYDGKEVSTEGSWEAGKDGAEAGLAMPAEPRVGDGYRQEYYQGVAEDRAEVLDLDTALTLAYGVFDDLLKTEESSPLEPEVVENKYYAKGTGLVSERTVEGGDEVVELVSYSR